MKKYIYSFILLFVTLFTFNGYVKGEEVLESFSVYPSSVSILENGDEIKVEKGDQGTFRFIKNDTKYINLELGKYSFENVKTMETTSYYVIYGSISDKTQNFSWNHTKCYIFKIKKDFTKTYSYIGESDDKASFVVDAIEFGVDDLITTILYDGEFNFLENYRGSYKFSTFDSELRITNSLDCGTYMPTLKLEYNEIVIESNDGIYYFDRDFNRVEKMMEENINGSFNLYETCNVNGTRYRAGSYFSKPGKYLLDNGKSETKTINLYPVVTGIENGGTYFDYIEYRLSGGDLYLNGEPVYLNGIIHEVGTYNLEIRGENGFIETISFKIVPKLLTEINNGDSLNIGDSIEFTGTAKLNDLEIKSGYKITSPGKYTLKLYQGDYQEFYTFTVPEALVSRTQRVWIFIVEGLCISGIVIAIVLIVLKNRKKHR